MGIRYKKIASEIKAMVAADQKAMRKADVDGEWEKFAKIAKINTEKLKKIVWHYGWPTIPMVGKEGNWGAWLIVQHSDHDKKFQEHCLKLMEEIWQKNPESVVGSNIAFLKDRILINGGKKQLYGSQFYVNRKGSLSPKPISRVKTLDKRRAEYGLRPFAEDLKAAQSYRSVSSTKKR